MMRPEKRRWIGRSNRQKEIRFMEIPVGTLVRIHGYDTVGTLIDSTSGKSRDDLVTVLTKNGPFKFRFGSVRSIE